MNSLKKLLTLCLLSLCVSVIIISCSEENSIDNQEKGFKTVSNIDALNFINFTKSLQAKDANEEYITGIYDSFLEHQVITNSNELLTIIPVTTKDEGLLSRIIMLEINNEIQAVVFGMLPNSNLENDSYTGELLITDLEGNFITGYKVIDNVFVSQYFGERIEDDEAKVFSGKSTGDTGGDGDCTTCNYSVCSLCDLDEVVVTGFTGAEYPYVSLTNMYPLDGGGNDYVNEWDYGGGSGYNNPLPSVDIGPKPLYSNPDKCAGVNEMWAMSMAGNSGNEFVGAVTENGGVIIIAEVDHDGGTFSGLHNSGQVTYYRYPISDGPLNGNFGQIESNGMYYIPLAATMHTHSPCADEFDVDGITDQMINDDRQIAQTYPYANHFIIGCNAIGQFDGSSNQAFNIQAGELTELCNNIN